MEKRTGKRSLRSGQDGCGGCGSTDRGGLGGEQGDRQETAVVVERVYGGGWSDGGAAGNTGDAGSKCLKSGIS